MLLGFGKCCGGVRGDRDCYQPASRESAAEWTKGVSIHVFGMGAEVEPIVLCDCAVVVRDEVFKHLMSLQLALAAIIKFMRKKRGEEY